MKNNLTISDLVFHEGDREKSIELEVFYEAGRQSGETFMVMLNTNTQVKSKVENCMF